MTRNDLSSWISDFQFLAILIGVIGPIAILLNARTAYPFCGMIPAAAGQKIQRRLSHAAPYAGVYESR